MLEEIVDDLLTPPSPGPCITALRQLPARPPVFVPLPTSVDPRLAGALRARGISQLYSHQTKAWALIENSQHDLVVTPTTSVKTLCYNLPVLHSLLGTPDARV